MYSGEAVETGTVKQVFDEMRHPYTRGLFNSIPLPGADQIARPLLPIRGQLPLPRRPAAGLLVRPALRSFPGRNLRHGRSRCSMSKATPGTRVRCRRYQEIDWSAKAAAGHTPAPMRSAAGARSRTAEEVLRDRATTRSGAMFSGKRSRFVKANEQLDFVAREAETVAIVGESGCGKTTFAKVMMGLETATEGEVKHQRQATSRHLPVQ